MFASLLIANRGEIACRIMRTARRLGIRTIAVYSDADAGARHVREADQAVRIGPADALSSYLNIEAVVAAAVATGAEAVHPGYGFLSENAAFAEACSAAGLVFVGPSPDAIRAMGSKRAAKEIVAAAGTPVVPGYQGSDQTDARLAAEAAQLGYPLLIKASAGGGGKGMRLVTAAEAFDAALAGARREAAGAFGDDTVLLERYLTRPKHIEVQILADQRGHTLHLFERDCSVQRRHQKVIEEAPGPTVDPVLRERLGAAAVQAARAIGYVGAGTIEFIAEGDAFYFMEMNTRLQVEHPVTEAITGLDLVEWQLRIAAGLPLALEQSAVAAVGHAIEARVYAENPRKGFLPSSGTLLAANFAGWVSALGEDPYVEGDGYSDAYAGLRPDADRAAGVRVDAGVAAGDQVSVHYDPMLAKIIAHGPDRQTAIRRLDAALARTVLVGVEHNVAFLRQVLATPVFRAGSYTTRLLDDDDAPVSSAPDDFGALLAALALRAQASRNGPWGRSDGFRLNLPGGFQTVLVHDNQPRSVRLDRDLGAGADGYERGTVDDRSYRLGDVECSGARVVARIDQQRVAGRVYCVGQMVHVARDGGTERWQLPSAQFDSGLGVGPGDRIAAPMPGQVIAVAVQVGDRVAEGAPLVIVEAMKMEHTLRAPRSGRVSSVACAVGDRVEEGVELVQLED